MFAQSQHKAVGAKSTGKKPKPSNALRGTLENIMKIKIEFTVEVDISQVKEYMAEVGIDDETPRDFVKSSIESAGIGCLEECLSNSGYRLGLVA